MKNCENLTEFTSNFCENACLFHLTPPTHPSGSIPPKSLAQVYTPMVRHNPILSIFFVLIIMVVPISLMNLVTAVIVEGSLEQAKQDQEVAKAYKNKLVVKMMPRIQQMFEKLDVDGSGDISIKEIESAPPELAAEQDRHQIVSAGAPLQELFLSMISFTFRRSAFSMKDSQSHDCKYVCKLSQCLLLI